MSKLSRLINYYVPLRDFLYILQLEEYNLIRYIKQIHPRLLRRNFERRDQLKYTLRTKGVYVISLLILISLIRNALLLSNIAFIVLLVALPLLTPYIIALGSFIFEPFAHIGAYLQIRRAQQYFATQHPNTKIVGITGSYGKTTTKYLLYELLKYSYKVEIIPDNINTTLGIAAHVLSHPIPDDTQYFIVEMGAYTRGDIRELTLMLPPSISVITKLGDQHLERFGSFENLVHAKYEIFEHAKHGTLKYTSDEAATTLREHNLSVENIFEISTHAQESSNVALATKIAFDLGVSDGFITDALAKFHAPDRRNATYQVNEVTVLDNSYNISPQTSVHILAEAKKVADKHSKKLVVMTAGISEQGTKRTSTNQAFGKLLNNYSSRVILHPSVYAKDISTALTIPFVEQELARTVLTDLGEHIDGTTEILLHLPEHSDLSYL
ncbi:MAG: UDP-N-acetylmuramoyl-tripeptide--D-alanyl-D-alanine ligase [Candidatus Azotimanducaceae bacterium]|jgi:UDP-N-acetylmuramoyl-tripeptide--D-alanyl-D-alanine ligase